MGKDSETPEAARIWERWPEESNAAYLAFRVYLHSPHKSLKKLSEELSMPHKTLMNNSSLWSWAKRSEAYLNEVGHRADVTAIDRVEQLARDHLNNWCRIRELGMTSLAKYAKMAKDSGDDDAPVVSAHTALQMVEKASHAERLVVGEATSREAQREELDLEKLDDDELTEFLRLNNKAKRS